MPADKDVVLKNFGYSSETHFMFYYVLQLFVSIEEGRTHDPYNIETETVYKLCEHPALLPENIQKFILWELNILERSYEDIMNIEMPRGLTKKYSVKQQYLRETEDVEDRKEHIQACLKEIDDYFEKFTEVIAVLETTENRFETVQDVLARAISMDNDLEVVLAEQKRIMADLGTKIHDLKSALEGEVLPDLIKFSETPEKAHQLIVALSQANLNIRAAINDYKEKRKEA